MFKNFCADAYFENIKDVSPEYLKEKGIDKECIIEMNFESFEFKDMTEKEFYQPELPPHFFCENKRNRVAPERKISNP